MRKYGISRNNFRKVGVISRRKLCEEIAGKLLELPGSIVTNIANDILLMIAGENESNYLVVCRDEEEFELQTTLPSHDEKE